MYFPEWIIIIMDIRRLKGNEETEGKKLEGKAKKGKKKGFLTPFPKCHQIFTPQNFLLPKYAGNLTKDP